MSSRAALLNKIGALFFVTSSGPFRYSNGRSRNPENVDELERHGWMFRTDRDDDACMEDPAKIGTDADGEAAGCDNFRMIVDGNARIAADYWVEAE